MDIEQRAPSSEGTPLATQKIVNDFCFSVATANGTGSQTSNIALLRAMFRMGIPVSGKNLFPSNIQGMPTWYRLRINKDGYTGYRNETEVLVAMNQATVVEDVTTVASGGVIFYNDSLKMPAQREDVTYYEMPVKALVKQVKVPPALRDYIANMVYVGVVCQMLGIDLEQIRGALSSHFKGKEKAVALNMEVVDLGANWAKENLTKQDPFYVEPMEGGNKDLILVDGNEAAALGSIYGGVSVVAWYPITPSTSLVDGITNHIPKLRKDADGKQTYAIIQAEDELAAIGMLMGAGWAGARSLTATSGPGISLMAEFSGLGYFAEIPAVIWNIQRMGPSTGLPTRTSQGDILFTYFLGHGDTKQVVLFPSSPKECFEFGHVSFDLAEQLQTPVFVLSDLDVGMNIWMSERFEYPEAPMNRGKVVSEDDLKELNTKWGRFVDFDGDGIPYRSLPGNKHPLSGYFTRGTGHNAKAIYSERPDDWQENLQRLRRKFDTARTLVPAPAVEKQEGATFGVISLGTNHGAVLEMMDYLKKDGHVCDYMRLKALPVNETVEQFIAQYDHVYIIENNFDGQLHKILQMEYPALATRLLSISQCTGLPLEASWLTQEITKHQQATD